MRFRDGRLGLDGEGGAAVCRVCEQEVACIGLHVVCGECAEVGEAERAEVREAIAGPLRRAEALLPVGGVTEAARDTPGAWKAKAVRRWPDRVAEAVGEPDGGGWFTFGRARKARCVYGALHDVRPPQGMEDTGSEEWRHFAPLLALAIYKAVDGLTAEVAAARLYPTKAGLLRALRETEVNEAGEVTQGMVGIEVV